ncbi:solute carrier family 22 member 13-like [Ornithodoros turicata]|uniref:solute carrier family 22 member 13-like n=1 Tax=Ornithodoros turicata TaxID=34597 RepID=UPI0031386FCA
MTRWYNNPKAGSKEAPKPSCNIAWHSYASTASPPYVEAEEPSVQLTAQSFRCPHPSGDLDDYYGTSGPFQAHVFYFVLLVFFVSSLHTYLSAIFIRDIDYWCAQPPESNLTEGQWLELCIPRSSDGSPDRCHIYVANRTKASCNIWVYNKDKSTRTFRDEFDLVCQREWMVVLIDALFFTGSLVSDFVSGTASDLLGRQPVILFNTFVLLCSGFAILGIPYHMLSFLAWRFFVGFGLESVCNTGLIMLAEVTSQHARSRAVVSVLMMHGVGYLFIWPLVLYQDNWLAVQFFILIPTVLLIVGIEVIVESPRWLVALRDVRGAKAVIFFAAIKNNVNIKEVTHKWNDHLDEIVRQCAPTPPLYDSWIDTHNPKVLLIMVTLCLSWLANAFAFYCFAMSAAGFIGDTTYMITSEVANVLCQTATFILALLSNAHLGRKWPSALYMLSCGLFCFPTLLLYDVDLVKDNRHASTWLTGKILLSLSHVVLNLYTLEVIPTVIRGRGFGACALFGKIGTILAVVRLRIPEPTRRTLYYILSALCLADCAFLMCLPETADKRLPDNLADLEESIIEHHKSMPKSTLSKYETCSAPPSCLTCTEQLPQVHTTEDGAAEATAVGYHTL